MNAVVFRALPGIAAIERQLELLVENRLMKDERQALEQAIDDKSLELFGITELETTHWLVPGEVGPGSLEEWEAHFEFLRWEFDEENTFWDAFGVDVRDEEGGQLLCIQWFGRQLVCALRRLHPKAVPTFMGDRGTDEELRAAAEAWGRRLTRGA